jgi:hypothetical protein
MINTIYVRLLGEGTRVYRPVPATKIADAVYVIAKDAPYDSDNETWEFSPGTKVVVEERALSGELQLVAVSVSS